MKIMFLYDRGSRNFGGIDLYEQIRECSALAAHDVDSALLSRDEIKHCTGCFGCWIYTPGRCVNTLDAAYSIVEKSGKADAVIMLSQITYGGFSSDAKSYIDRRLSHSLPFFRIINGEMHHKKRYKRHIWIPIGYGDFLEDERITFIKLADRNAITFDSPKHLALTVNKTTELSNTLEELSEFLKEGNE